VVAVVGVSGWVVAVLYIYGPCRSGDARAVGG
jgi:hypothetical protein